MRADLVEPSPNAFGKWAWLLGTSARGADLAAIDAAIDIDREA